jgi:hypothetical protein
MRGHRDDPTMRTTLRVVRSDRQACGLCDLIIRHGEAPKLGQQVL